MRASPFNGVAGKLVLLAAAELNAAHCVARLSLAKLASDATAAFRTKKIHVTNTLFMAKSLKYLVS